MGAEEWIRHGWPSASIWLHFTGCGRRVKIAPTVSGLMESLSSLFGSLSPWMKVLLGRGLELGSNDVK